jgi:uncharacterized coiled-coil protein SlyX
MTLPFMKEWTPGGVGVWVLVLMFAGTLWRGLPKVIDAIANRRSKIEERLSVEMDAMAARFSGQIVDADHRHEECIRGQEALRSRIDGQDKIIATQGETIAKQNQTISAQSQTIFELNNDLQGLRAQHRQAGQSIVELLPSVPPTTAARMKS